MPYVLVLIVVAVVVYAISAPLRAQRSAGRAQPDPVAELEAARDAKYREIRDAELDLRTGKLSRADYESIDGTLRAEALEILNRLQALTGADAGETDGA